jgi:two-component system, OmpR family, sensor kinase
MEMQRPLWRRIGARLPLPWRLALVSFGIAAVLLSAVGTLIASTDEHTLLSNQANSLRVQIRIGPLAKFLPIAPARLPPVGPLPNEIPEVDSPAEQRDPRQLLSSLMTGLYAGGTIRATALLPDGSVIVTKPDDTTTPFVSVGIADIQRVLVTAPQPTDYLLAIDTTGQRQVVALLPIVIEQHTVGVMQLSTPVTAIHQAINTNHLILELGIATALIIAAAVTLPLIRVALRPLTEMEHATKRIAGGELSLRLPPPTTQDEIGQLATSFNDMVAQLEAAFARQRQFVADVSHELRTPITVLSNGLEMLLIGAHNGDGAAEHRITQNLYAEVERLRRLVEDLLTLARLDEGQLPLRLEQIDLAALCAGVCEQVQPLADGQGIHCEISPDLPAITADADRLRQILLNLVYNAVAHTPADGTITLHTRPDPTGIAIGVRDTGTGIPPEDLPHVFERFYRGDPARARSSQHAGSAGLGLAIAKGLVEAHGGEISIASTVGQGTTVTVHLPLDV